MALDSCDDVEDTESAELVTIPEHHERNSVILKRLSPEWLMTAFIQLFHNVKDLFSHGEFLFRLIAYVTNMVTLMKQQNWWTNMAKKYLLYSRQCYVHILFIVLYAIFGFLAFIFTCINQRENEMKSTATNALADIKASCSPRSGYNKRKLRSKKRKELKKSFSIFSSLFLVLSILLKIRYSLGTCFVPEMSAVQSAVVTDPQLIAFTIVTCILECIIIGYDLKTTSPHSSTCLKIWNRVLSFLQANLTPVIGFLLVLNLTMGLNGHCVLHTFKVQCEDIQTLIALAFEAPVLISGSIGTLTNVTLNFNIPIYLRRVSVLKSDLNGILITQQKVPADVSDFFGLWDKKNFNWTAFQKSLPTVSYVTESDVMMLSSKDGTRLMFNYDNSPLLGITPNITRSFVIQAKFDSTWSKMKYAYAYFFKHPGSNKWELSHDRNKPTEVSGLDSQSAADFRDFLNSSCDIMANSVSPFYADLKDKREVAVISCNTTCNCDGVTFLSRYCKFICWNYWKKSTTELNENFTRQLSESGPIQHPYSCQQDRKPSKDYKSRVMPPYVEFRRGIEVMNAIHDAEWKVKDPDEFSTHPNCQHIYYFIWTAGLSAVLGQVILNIILIQGCCRDTHTADSETSSQQSARLESDQNTTNSTQQTPRPMNNTLERRLTI